VAAQSRNGIGYYAHHHGRGHLTRARTLAEHLPAVTVLSSAPAEPWAPWVELPLDTGGLVPLDPTVGGALHWAPRGHAGLRSRMAAMATWVEDAAPAAVVVDVSVEAALFLRLMGVPVVVFAMPGRRDDVPHQLGYAIADRIIAPWPEEVHQAQHLEAHRDRVVHVGALSRHDGREVSQAHADGRRALVLQGSGGSSLTARVLGRLKANLPGWHLDVLGPSHWVSDPWPHLVRADVVIAHAGQGVIADIAAAQRPAVLVPEDRPFEEQGVLAADLEQAGLAIVRPSWDAITGADLLEAVRRGSSWQRWRTAGAAQRAAAVVREVARA
jgi:UDP-N-acetylglucosamine--N-acetylmuramyl-(pentapeptide) pyrophosphoryl-undecaprenol N-acetylglucosamine transferase